MRSLRARRNRRLLLAALLVPAAGYVAYQALTAPAPSGTGSGTGSGRAPAGDAPPGAVAAYLSATGIFARPGPAQRPAAYAAAEAAAAEAGSPLAFSIWTDTPAFDAEAWRDQIQVGRIPSFRPPAVDFDREVAVLVWPAEGAPAEVRRAQGLILRGAMLQHLEVEVRVAPATDSIPRATPAGSGDVLPYALVTVPRRQWPIPAPPPTVPPLTVSLVA